MWLLEHKQPMTILLSYVTSLAHGFVYKVGKAREVVSGRCVELDRFGGLRALRMQAS